MKKLSDNKFLFALVFFVLGAVSALAINHYRMQYRFNQEQKSINGQGLNSLYHVNQQAQVLA